MRTTKIAKTVYLIVTLFSGLISVAKSQAGLLDQVLDLNQLPQYSYFGQDDLHRRAACHLEVDPAQRDFAGRPFQNFRVWVDPNLVSVTVKYRGAARTLSPDSQAPDNSLRYRFQADGYEIQILSRGENTNDIVDFQLNDLTGVTGRPGPVVHCMGVRNNHR